MPNVPDYNRLNNALSEQTPTIIVPVGEVLSDELASEVCADADVAELRIDLFQPCSDSLISSQIERFACMPVLGTIRDRAELGKWIGSVDEKVALFERFLMEVDGVDIELASSGLERVIAMADGKVVIVSSHHTSAEAPIMLPQLEHRFDKSMRAGADYFKIAARADDEVALAQLSLFMEFNPEAPIIAVSMGRLGVQGRLDLVDRGSRGTFAYVGDTPVAPGQISLSAARAAIPRSVAT